MQKRNLRKLSLSRESIRQLETDQSTLVRGALGGTKFGTLCHSCHYGCPNYTLFPSCTC